MQVIMHIIHVFMQGLMPVITQSIFVSHYSSSNFLFEFFDSYNLFHKQDRLCEHGMALFAFVEPVVWLQEGKNAWLLNS